MGSPAGCSRNFLETVANVKGLQSGLFFDHMLPRWGRNRVEGLQTEPRAAPASGALPGFQPHLLLETESHGAWGPGSRRPFPTPVPSGPNEVGISPQLLCPRAWVLPEARPGPGARPSAPAWPGSASKTGFHGRHRSCARATAPRAPHDSVVRNWEPPPRSRIRGKGQ